MDTVENKNQENLETHVSETKKDSKIMNRISALLSVKSLVTLCLTLVFAYMAITGSISQDFMTIYAVIIAFYFGTQSQKIQDAVSDQKGE